MNRITRLTLLTVICAVAAGLWPAEAAAQRRAVRGRVIGSVLVGPRHFYSVHWPAFYDPFFNQRWYGQYPYPRYGWRRPMYDNTGSARLQVSPREAEVYVDGYFVGTVDDFDGVLQRLHVPAGEHELQFYLEGHRPLRHKVLFTRGTTVKITDTMEPLPSGETNEPRPKPDPSAPPPDRRGGRSAAPYGTAEREMYGAIAIRVQPPDAIILIDGEQWDRPEGETRLVVDLPEGPHRVEVRKDGYRTYTTTVRVRRGETVTLNVSLSSGDVSD